MIMICHFWKFQQNMVEKNLIKPTTILPTHLNTKNFSWILKALMFDKRKKKKKREISVQEAEFTPQVRYEELVLAFVKLRWLDQYMLEL